MLVAHPVARLAGDYPFSQPRTAYLLSIAGSATEVVERSTGLRTSVPFGARMTFNGIPKFSKDSATLVRAPRAYVESYQPWSTLVDAPTDLLTTGAAYVYGAGGWGSGQLPPNLQPHVPDRADKVVLAYVNAMEFTATGRWDPSFDPAWDRDGNAVIDAGTTGLPGYVDVAVFNAAWKSYVAAYWTDAWRQQLARKIDHMAVEHFDGIMLDMMGGYWPWKNAYPGMDPAGLRAATADLFRWISAYAKGRYGKAFVVAANLDPDVRLYFPDLAQHVDVGYYQNAFFEWKGSGVVNGYGLSVRPDTFSNPAIDFLRAQGMPVVTLDHLGTGTIAPGLDFVDYNDRITLPNLLRVFRWAVESGTTPYVAPVFFGPPYAMIPRFARIVPNTLDRSSSPYADWVIGSSGDDTVAAGAGDDLVAGGAGNDHIDGGSGTNAAFYRGGRDRFAIQGMPGGGVLVSDRSGQEGVDALANVQYLLFADQWLSVAGLPGTPSNLTALAQGRNVRFDWQPAASGGAPAGFAIEAGTAPGLADLGRIATGPRPAFGVAAVPDGRYFVRVRATNAVGESAPSNELALTVSCAAPAAPSLAGTVTARTVSLSWSPVAGSSGYRLEAGMSPAAVDVGVLDLGAVTAFSAAAPPGTFFVRVRALSPCGTSGPSNEVVATVSGTPAPAH